jgi:hypothetical protein
MPTRTSAMPASAAWITASSMPATSTATPATAAVSAAIMWSANDGATEHANNAAAAVSVTKSLLMSIVRVLR